MIILDLNDVVETNHISCQKAIVYYLVWKSAFVLHKHGLLNLVMQELFFPVSVFDKSAVNMTSCSKVDEETSKEDVRQENFPAEMGKTLATLKAISVCLN